MECITTERATSNKGLEKEVMELLKPYNLTREKTLDFINSLKDDVLDGVYHQEEMKKKEYEGIRDTAHSALNLVVALQNSISHIKTALWIAGSMSFVSIIMSLVLLIRILK